MARLVLDASVLIAYFSPIDPRHARAVALLQRTASDERIVIASVLAELLVHPYRMGRDAVGQVEAALAALPTVIEPIDAELARRAAELRAVHARLRLGDALVIAAGEVLGAQVVTVDVSWSRISGRVRQL